MAEGQTNPYFDLAVKFVNSTARHLFLTGKAGTGKTTFLKYIKENCHKKMAIVAPTGVAAINAGGVTIHSFFQLPFGSYFPSGNLENGDEGNFYDRRSLLKHLRFNSSKRMLLQELELLIIDEVSMVRADILDAMDTVLKYIRRKPSEPFGGVQMLYIGDLFQLPPVINELDWRILSKHYQGAFFFHANSIQQSPPLFLELKKIWRQNDQVFINLLNNIRNNQVSKEEIQLLNSYYKPTFKPEKKGEYITLTTHNGKAEIINNGELKKLKGTLYRFKADVKGEFNEKAVPAETELHLKEGAQVMFLKNDKGEVKRFYNGKIGTIKKINSEEIIVSFPDESEDLKVEKETWKNVRYKFNQEEDRIEEDELGTFTQYPIRLAWAITIHKSQGLTFNKAIIDAGDSFAPGQVYVALSRLTSLDGLVLYSRIFPDCISTDEEALLFSKGELEKEKLEQQLKEAQTKFIHSLVTKSFEWTKLLEVLQQFKTVLEEKNISFIEEAKLLAKNLLNAATEQQKTADKFCRQLEQYFLEAETDSYSHVQSRVEAAANYFKNSLHNELFVPVKDHYEKFKLKSRIKKYLEEVEKVAALIKQKKYKIEEAEKITAGLKAGADINLVLANLSSQNQTKELAVDSFSAKKKKGKQVKGQSHRISLDLYLEGKTISEIAELRGLASSTIEGHLISFIETGEIDVSKFVSTEKLLAIKTIINDNEELASSAIKEKLGDNYTYSEIRATQNYLKSLELKEV